MAIGQTVSLKFATITKVNNYWK
ncbi:MAG: hypothetical protein ACRBFS_05730 [Aureispira sp.]